MGQHLSHNCKLELNLPVLISTTNIESLASGPEGLEVDVDTQTGKSRLLVVVGSFAEAELRCYVITSKDGFTASPKGTCGASLRQMAVKCDRNDVFFGVK